MSNPKTPDKICEAAIRVASRDGLTAMTLDNVAREAGISKGGVMYHFPSKDELMEAVMAYFGNQVEQMLLRKVATDPNPNWRWARAMLNSALPDPNQPPETDAPFDDEVIERFMLATLAGAVNNPGFLAPLRTFGKQLQQRLLTDSADGMDQLLIWLMVDGLFLWQFLGLIQRDEPLFGQISDVLRAKVAGHQLLASPPTPAAKSKRKSS